MKLYRALMALRRLGVDPSRTPVKMANGDNVVMANGDTVITVPYSPPVLDRTPPVPTPNYTKRQATNRVNTRNFSYTRTSTTRHRFRIRVTVAANMGTASGFVVVFPGFAFSANGSGDLASTYDKTITGCAIEYPPNQINRVTFNTGSNSVVVPGGLTAVYSDQVLDSVTGLTWQPPAGAVAFLQVDYTRSDGLFAYDAPQEVWPSLGEYSNYVNGGADESQIPIATNPNAGVNIGQAWAPAMILADSSLGSVQAIAMVGNSIATGSGGDNTSVQIENAGYVARGIGNTFPWMRITCPQASLSSALNGTANLSLIANGRVTHAIVEMGINDVLGGASFSQIQSRFLSLWLTLHRMGIRVTQGTLLPATDCAQPIVSLSAIGTTVTAGYGAAPVAPTVGLLVDIKGCTPSAYNTAANATVAVTSVDTTAKTFTYTAATAPGVATVLGTWADQWTSAGNQYPRAGEPVRVLANDWIRTDPYPLQGHHEAADRVEVNGSNVLTRNGGRWLVTTGQATPDGTHPAPVTSAIAAGGINLSFFA